MNEILTATLILGGIAFLLGLLIAVVRKVFAVEEDPNVARIYDMLPHLDCGTCGTAGCMDMAQQLNSREITQDKCRPLRGENKEKLQDFLVDLYANKNPE